MNLQASGLENRRLLVHIGSMGSNGLLAVCAALVCFGVLTIVVSPGFFMNLLGAGMLATGGAAAYLISSHRSSRP
jgi:hypothetical protein